MKIALVHDALCNVGGAEKVFQYLCEEFDEADIYTSCYNANETLGYYKTVNIRTTFAGKFINNPKRFRLSLLYGMHSMENINLSNYDVVISSSASIAKYVKANKGKHFSYCYYPTRAIWEANKYFGRSILKYLIKPLIPYLKYREKKAVNGVDQFIAISKNTAEHIKQYYNRESVIIYCPIDTDNFYSTENKLDHYLIVSRMEEWKKLDHAIEAFNILGYPLRIIGTGNTLKKLKNISGPNIDFLGFVDESKLAYEYSVAKAVIFTPELEYGLIPLEAIASGTPVIAYGYGGIKETMNPYSDESNIDENGYHTAVFYYEQSAKSLIAAIEKFETISFDTKELINYAKRWDIISFKKKFREYITKNV